MATTLKKFKKCAMKSQSKEIPILFSGLMVRAIMNGKKTMTRRQVVPMRGRQSEWLTTDKINQSPNLEICRSHEGDGYGDLGAQMEHPKGGPLGWVRCPYGKPGDVLWVRENLKQHGELGLSYVADNTDIDESKIPEDYKPYRDYAHCIVPAIHMQKSVARIWLEVVQVRVERLNDINELDAINEGIESHVPVPGDGSIVFKGYNGTRPTYSPLLSFVSLWNEINGNWDANPWVWVISFKVLSTTGKP